MCGSVYRVLRAAGLLERWNARPSSKGTGFQQPVGLHEHWHIDVSYLNICRTFYYGFAPPSTPSRMEPEAVLGS